MDGMSSDARTARVALACLVEPGSVELDRLIAGYGPEEALDAVVKGKVAEPVAESVRARLAGTDPRRIAETALARTARIGARVAIPEDEEWPDQTTRRDAGRPGYRSAAVPVGTRRGTARAGPGPLGRGGRRPGGDQLRHPCRPGVELRTGQPGLDGRVRRCLRHRRGGPPGCARGGRHHRGGARLRRRPGLSRREREPLRADRRGGTAAQRVAAGRRPAPAPVPDP